MTRNIVILGGGLAGLSAAYHLGDGCAVYEQEARCGGLARSERVKGFTFDQDGHLLHFKDSYARTLVESLLPGQLVLHKRNAWVFSHNTYTHYPFQAHTYGLPTSIIKRCIMGMSEAVARSQAANGRGNLKDWMEQHFGHGITRHFMYPYNWKFWTVPPERLIPDWTASYVPLVKLRDVVDGAFAEDIRPLGYNSEFWYPKTGGMEQLVTSLVRRVSPVHTNHRAVEIDYERRLVRFANGHAARFTHLVSTVPLIELHKFLRPAPPRCVARAFGKLKYVSVYNVNLGVDRPAITDKHWIYFPEQKYCFFRVGFPANFSYDVAPPGTSSMYVEISYSRYRPLRRHALMGRIRRDLIAAGLLRKNDRILVTQKNDIRYAYSMYDHAYRENTRIIHEFLSRHHIWGAGRSGRWQYMSMEDALLDGRQISTQISRIG